ncbi:MBOAT family protein [Candidatus Acetothermia bacterium]|nr:MBOAT family protein [Candidatus Acetothermia bacterium]MBI3643579.1 MBOAT family protein [Candidatus Acetothermia bacterium]
MIFTSYDYVLFFILIFVSYWLLRQRTYQNVLLLSGSYIFYGYIHPWFCILIAASTIVDYLCALAMIRYAQRKKYWLVTSLAWNLTLLGVFKYYNFFIDNFHQILTGLGIPVQLASLSIILPVGISFYTFQSLTYTIGVYKGDVQPRKNFIDFALFVCFFPQLLSGPIERANQLLPQIESARVWTWSRFFEAWPLIIGGFLKKMVIADNVAVYADQVYSLQSPGFLILAAGTLAFAVQILADFSGYTDIARGSAKLLGFDLVINFNSPYIAISPSDFWRRWHISFSSWIRDYLYIPLGGSRLKERWRFLLVLLGTLGLSGLWHGAAWHFVIWGLYHSLIVFVYHSLGFKGSWKPIGWLKTSFAWSIMFSLTLVGWMFFRTSSIGWLIDNITHFNLGLTVNSLLASVAIIALVLLYSLPLFLLFILERFFQKSRWLHTLFYGLAIAAIYFFSREATRDFIYFKF